MRAILILLSNYQQEKWMYQNVKLFFKEHLFKSILKKICKKRQNMSKGTLIWTQRSFAAMLACFDNGYGPISSSCLVWSFIKDQWTRSFWKFWDDPLTFVRPRSVQEGQLSQCHAVLHNATVHFYEFQGVETSYLCKYRYNKVQL